MKHQLLKTSQILATTMVLCFIVTLSKAQIYYVKTDAAGLADGSSWSNAFIDLQVAIDLTSDGDTICVAAGVYTPTHIKGPDTIRNATFLIHKSILLFGGFSGEPGTEGNFIDRNPNVHISTLSGDVGLPGDGSDNAFHVLYFDHVSDTTRLDGFVVSDGNGFNGGGLDGLGAGIFNDASSGRSHPVIANCVIRNNSSQETGGGMWNDASNGGLANPLFIHSDFILNDGSGGGGITNYADTEGEANPVFIACRFMGNQARTAQGGAISCIAHSATSSPTLINCIVTGNHSPTSSAIESFVTGTGISSPQIINSAVSGNTGGAIRVVDLGSKASVVKIRNSIIFGNAGGSGITTNGATVDAAFSIIPFGFPGENIIGLDPLFVSQPPLDSTNTEGDLHLQEGSPAIDAGRNSDVPTGIDSDFDNYPRFVNSENGQPGTVDIGPYEFQGNTTAVSDFLSATDWTIHPTLANDAITVELTASGVVTQLSILDLKGNMISAQRLQPGQDIYELNVSDLAAGVYLVHLILNGRQDVKKIVVQ